MSLFADSQHISHCRFLGIHIAFSAAYTPNSYVYLCEVYALVTRRWK